MRAVVMPPASVKYFSKKRPAVNENPGQFTLTNANGETIIYNTNETEKQQVKPALCHAAGQFGLRGRGGLLWMRRKR